MMKELKNRVDAHRAAILVIDVQNDFCHPEGALAKAGGDVSMAEPMGNHLEEFLARARAVALPVIFIANRHSRWTDSPSWVRRHRQPGRQVCRPGAWGAEFYKVSPLGDEPVVYKHRYSAFIDTDLDLILRSQGIKSLLITGTGTNVCVESTARDAFMKDYQLVFVEDCLAAGSKQEHDHTLETMKKYFDALVVNWQEIVELWKG